MLIVCFFYQVWICVVFGNVLFELVDVEIGIYFVLDFVVFLEQLL